MFTLRDDEADARMSELHERFSVARYAWVYSLHPTKLRRFGPLGVLLLRRDELDHMSLDEMFHRTVRATGRVVNASGNTIGRTFDITGPFIGACNVSVGVAPHA